MSEVIVRMKMPKSCNDCGLAVDGWCYAILATAPQPGDLDFVKRPDWCPILAVLPEQHGRLVDAYEIVRFKERLVVDADKIKPEIRYVVDTKYICDIPTIVPATERSEA